MIKRDVLSLGEGHAEQAVCDVESRLDHFVELQIRLDLALVEIEQRLAPFLRVIAPIPRREGEIAALLGGDRLQRLGFAQRLRARRRPDRMQEIERGARRLRHRVVEPEMRVALEAEQRRGLGAQAHGFGGDGAIVGGAVVLAARAPRRERLLAQIAARRKLQEGLDARARKRNGVLAWRSARGGGRGGRGEQRVRRGTGAILRTSPSGSTNSFSSARTFCSPELRAERRETLVDRWREARPAGVRRQPGAVAHEVDVVEMQDARLLVRQAGGALP